MPLILLIAIGWLAVVGVVVVLCVAAAHADAALVCSRAEHPGRAYLPGVVLWHGVSELEDEAPQSRERVLLRAGR